MPRLTVKLPPKDLDEAYQTVMKHVPAGKWTTKEHVASVAFRIGLNQVKGMNLDKVLESLTQ